MGAASCFACAGVDSACGGSLEGAAVAMLVLHDTLRSKRVRAGSSLRSINFPSGLALLGCTLRLLAKITALQDQQPKVIRCMQGSICRKD